MDTVYGRIVLRTAHKEVLNQLLTLRQQEYILVHMRNVHNVRGGEL